MYMVFKHTHMTLALLSVSLLLFRFVLSLRQADMLKNKFFKIVPHVVDTLLLLSALALMWQIQQFPFVHPWLTEKLFGVLAYIALGIMALKGRTTGLRWFALFGALGWLGLVIRVAISKTPILFG